MLCQTSKSNITFHFKIITCGSLIYCFHTNPHFAIGQLHAKLTRNRRNMWHMCQWKFLQLNKHSFKKVRMQLQPSLSQTTKQNSESQTTKQNKLKVKMFYLVPAIRVSNLRWAWLMEETTRSWEGIFQRAEGRWEKSEAGAAVLHCTSLSVYLVTWCMPYLNKRQTDTCDAWCPGSVTAAWGVTHILHVTLQSLTQAYGTLNHVKSLLKSDKECSRSQILHIK